MTGLLTKLSRSYNEPQKLLETVILRLKLMQRETQSISELHWRNSRGLIHHQEEKLNTCCLSLGKEEPTARPWGPGVALAPREWGCVIY